MRKKILEQRLARLRTKVAKLSERAKASTDANEVRNMTEELEDLNSEISETQAELDAINEEERTAEQQAEEQRSAAPATLEGAQILGAFSQNAGEAEKRDEEPTSTMEYRQAFMNYVQKGTPIELRNGEAISTNETGAAIPMTIMNEVINTVRKRYGNLYNKVRKMSVPGGVKIPIGALQAQFKWINESTVSPRQKVDKLGSIVFEYNTAEIRIAQTFLRSSRYKHNHT